MILFSSENSDPNFDHMKSDVHFRMLQRLKELHLVYYVSSMNKVMVQYMGLWTPYDVVMKYDKRLVV